jgi:5-methylcytosine-specific restriction protein A
MPAALSSCTTLSCPHLSEGGPCPGCRREQRAASDARRPSSSQRGYDSAWQRTRAAYLQAHPLCECDCGAQSTDVHHLDGEGPLGPRGHDWSNLQALAGDCHKRVTAREQPGGWAIR